MPENSEIRQRESFSRLFAFLISSLLSIAIIGLFAFCLLPTFLTLTYVDAITPATTNQKTCSFSSNFFSCQDYNLSIQGQLYFVLGQASGNDVIITGIYCSQEKNTPEQSKFDNSAPKIIIHSGENVIISPYYSNYTYCRDPHGIPIQGLPGEKYVGTIWIRYSTKNPNDLHFIQADFSTPVH